MKYIILSILLVFCYHLSAQNNDVETFLEEELRPFANVRDIAINSGGDYLVFTAQDYLGDNSTLIEMKKTDQRWTNPKVLSFSGEFNDLEPFLSQDGNTLFFASNRPLTLSSNEPKDFDIWYSKRSPDNGDWSQPVNVGAPINTQLDEFYPTITSSGNIYFTLNADENSSKDDIYVSFFVEGNFSEPVKLAGGINTDGYEFNAFVSPDESFILFSGYNREDGLGSGDIYYSLNNGNNNWSPAVNLGPMINSDKMDYCPYIDMENEILYFTSRREESNSEDSVPITIESLLESYTKKVGLNRLFRVDFSEWLNKIPKN